MYESGRNPSATNPFSSSIVASARRLVLTDREAGLITMPSLAQFSTDRSQLILPAGTTFQAAAEQSSNVWDWYFWSNRTILVPWLDDTGTDILINFFL